MDELSVRRTRKWLAALSEAELIAYGEALAADPHQVAEVGQLVVDEFVGRYPELATVLAS